MENNNDDSLTGQVIDENAYENKPILQLYSKEAIMGFSFFFSTLYASFLVITNFREAGARKGIIPVVLFVLIFTILEVLIMTMLPPKLNVLTIAFNFSGGLILNLYFSKKYIPADVVYENKKIWKPLLIGIILVTVLLALALFQLEHFGTK